MPRRKAAARNEKVKNRGDSPGQRDKPALPSAESAGEHKGIVASPSANSDATALARRDSDDYSSRLQAGFKLSGDQFTNDAGRADLHGYGLTGSAYFKQIAKVAQSTMGSDGSLGVICTALDHVKQSMNAMKCRDPLEQTLVAQALLTHSRIVHLSNMACAATDPSAIEMLNDACDKASNTYRRQMLALQAYRQPKQPHLAINQANIAHQQLVQNAAGGEKNMTNEQGWQDEQPDTTHQKPPPLLAESGGAEVPASGRGRSKAVAGKHGPAHRSG